MNKCTKVVWLLLVLLVFFVTACAQMDDKKLSPYDLAQFRNVLNNSRLQWPESHAVVTYGQFEDFTAEYFYLSKDGYMTFETRRGQYDDVTRVELRQGPDEWKTSARKMQRMLGELRLFYPETIKEYTWMQIHDTKTTEPYINKPLLRLLWRKKRAGNLDHLWAIVRTNKYATGGSAPLWVDLGARPNGFFRAEVSIQNNVLIVKINNLEKLNYNVSYWQEYQNAFKAGIYLSGSANEDIGIDDKLVKLQFRSLRYDLLK